MSQPPTTVQVKRRRTDEPVDFLRVHELTGKRQRTGNFVFSRQPTPITEGASPAIQSQPQAGRQIKPIHRSIQSSNAASNNEGVVTQGEGSSEIAGTEKSANAPVPEVEMEDLTAGNPRRFHMSRKSMQNPLELGKGRKRGATNSLTFMERKARKLPLGTKEVVGTKEVASDVPEESPVETPRPRKKPGLSSRIKGSPATDPTTPKLSPKPAQLQNIRLPNGTIMPWDVNSEVLAAEMQAYTLQEIGRNIEQANKFQSGRDKQISSPLRQSTPSKFKPKKPALRYAERHPEEAAKMNAIDAMDMDDWSSGDEDMGDDSDPKNFGLLILESQPDIDEFYLEEQDSDEDDEDEDEDENAENHYSADYPDDEVDSDDEFDRNPYSYRHDAFDEDDATFSGDEKPAWLKQSDMSDGEEDDEI
ncbi:hypothetical protein M7I_5592 [Glarea lozoyensis 74030]|uniref:Transcription factor Iwr1 domain-containing protein n=1 Tax=Glarea lozoyensis (strain ATCC 74030 / MF5533) TaxID=1104152 RepID=H0ESB4_GLAL7|nr:hypothetical protein M7I_5592 [Glarea lozoyensis 74030]